MAKQYKYGEDFFGDKKAAEIAERILFEVIDNELWPDYVTELKTNDQAWWHRGDVAVLDYNGKDIGIDAKNDKLCHTTGNFYLEEYIQRGNDVSDGWMRNGQYDVLAIVSRAAHKIYFIDFPRLQQEYTQLRFRWGVPSYFAEHTCFGSLVKIQKIRESGLMLAETEYEGDEQQGFWRKEIQEKTA